MHRELHPVRLELALKQLALEWPEGLKLTYPRILHTLF